MSMTKQAEEKVKIWYIKNPVWVVKQYHEYTSKLSKAFTNLTSAATKTIAE